MHSFILRYSFESLLDSIANINRSIIGIQVTVPFNYRQKNLLMRVTSTLALTYLNTKESVHPVSVNLRRRA